MKATIDTFTGVAVAKEDMIKNRFGQYWVLSMLAGMYIGFGILLIFTVERSSLPLVLQPLRLLWVYLSESP